jgi:general nucleoside transport system permease protein
MRLEPRTDASPAIFVLAPLGALGVSLIIAAVLVMWSGASALGTFALVIKGAAGSQFALLETLTRSTPLIFTGLAAAVAFRAKLWNIGGEGQLYIGAVLAVALGTGLLPLPAPVLVPILLLAGAVGGALTLLGPTLLKNRFGVDEVVTTLLLNFIVVLFVSLLLDGPIKDPMGLGWPQSPKVAPEAALPKLVQGKRLHAGFLLAILAALVVWFVNARTALG